MFGRTIVVRPKRTRERDGTRLKQPWRRTKENKYVLRKKKNIYSKQKLLNTQRPNTWPPETLSACIRYTRWSIIRWPHSLSARVTFYTRQRAHVYVARGALFRWPRLLPFILTSFVDSIETWYITRRASHHVDILSMHKCLKCNAHKILNLFKTNRRCEVNGSSKTHSIILNVVIMEWKCVLNNSKEASDDRRSVRYSIHIPDWRIVSSAAVLSIRFVYSTRARIGKKSRKIDT